MGVKRKKSETTDKPKEKTAGISLHDEIKYKAANWLKRHKSNIRVPNCPTIVADLVSLNTTGEVPDVIGWNSYLSVLIEVKVSRNDFLKDNKKRFRQFGEFGMGDLRFYCCPKGMIKPEELPEKWGLLYYNEKKRIEFIKPAEKQDANLVSERGILLSVIRRLKKDLEMRIVKSLNQY